MSPSFERREYKRYLITLDVQIKIRKEGKLIDAGGGKIQNISRVGIFLESNELVPAGVVLRLIVDWPVRFQGKTRVDWIVDGVVVRSTDSGMAVNIMRQWFERDRQGKRKKLAS
jgi:hypothetical protein